ncbi:MAG: DJ-1/PfpI family protein [Ginsengibacter sp.]
MYTNQPQSNTANRVIFFIANGVHALDLAGPLQVFYECGTYQKPFEIIYISDRHSQNLSSGLSINSLNLFSTIEITSDDIIVIPGFDLGEYNKRNYSAFYKWLQNANTKKAMICSICTGVFALAKAGLLNGKECTTHWKYVNELQQLFPNIKVLQNRLFVSCGNIYTSAGITTGIDMALFIIEQKYGAQFAYQIARELVMYIRRDGSNAQESVYLHYRYHINTQIHEIQDWILHHLYKRIRIDDLATKIHTSPRNLTRIFKVSTGITIGTYIEKMKVELAINLLKQDKKTLDVAKRTGFKSVVQLRNIIKKNTGKLPSDFYKSSL